MLELIEKVEIDQSKISTYNAQSLRDDLLDQVLIHINEHYTYNDAS